MVIVRTALNGQQGFLVDAALSLRVVQFSCEFLTSGSKMASGRWICRARKIALKNNSASCPLFARIRQWNR